VLHHDEINQHLKTTNNNVLNKNSFSKTRNTIVLILLISLVGFNIIFANKWLILFFFVFTLLLPIKILVEEKNFY